MCWLASKFIGETKNLMKEFNKKNDKKILLIIIIIVIAILRSDIMRNHKIKWSNI